MASALVLLYSALFLSSVLFEVYGQDVLLNFPPRGWNSYDSFSWIVDEESFLDNAEIVSSRLLSFGYEYVVVDFLWYRKNVNRASVDSYGYDNIDEWGRLVPDPDRWPSSRFGKGFKEVARKVHDMGLKFGIHVMRGVSLQTFNSNKTILDVTTGLPYEENGRIWHAGDIGIRNMPCSWMKHGFMSVNTDLGAGRAFLRSLYQQYADWDVDFVKLDCVFGDDLNKEEIVTVSEILEGLGRHVLFSLSPGTSVTPSMAESVRDYVDIYRITGDTWDRWDDITAHFDVARDFAAAKLIGVNGLHGNSWPDLDMLPLGWLTDPGVRNGPHRKCSLTRDEQRTLLTLWSIAKSPLMFGGDLRHLDDLTFTLITNPTLLELNSYSLNNADMRSLNEDGTLFSRYSDLRATTKSLKANVNAGGIRSWMATGRRAMGGCCVANADVAWKMDRILLRYRPIAPKPPATAPGTAVEPAPSGGRAKRRGGARRKASTGGTGGGRRGKSKKVEAALAPVVTLSLLPETPERKEGGVTAPVFPSEWEGKERTGLVVIPRPVRAASAWVTVESVADAWGLEFCGSGGDDEVRRLLDVEDCPAFVSDTADRVTWTNAAYRRMVVGGDELPLSSSSSSSSSHNSSSSAEEDVRVALVTKGLVPGGSCRAFTCMARVRYACRRRGSVSVAVPCDVRRMEDDGWAWRLDVKAALSLSTMAWF